ncbi:hypothetical protein BT69DRAFT_1278692 [Atractiella rhizophila]|nr:hypothetical protein BT69DRAFT_1278692 [Atractiella rhizophila]
MTIDNPNENDRHSLKDKIYSILPHPPTGPQQGQHGAHNNPKEVRGLHGDGKGGSFGILPHPAKTNDPSDLKEEDWKRHDAKFFGGGPGVQTAPGPHIPSKETAHSLEEPLGRDELRKRQEELNRK